MCIGTSMNEGNGKAIKTLVIVLGIIVYVMMLLYSGVHNISLMLRGVDPQWQAVAIAGVIALEVSPPPCPWRSTSGHMTPCTASPLLLFTAWTCC